MIELGRVEEVIREMEKLANHTHIAAEEELNAYRSNADFKEALSTLRRLRNEDDQAIGGKALPHLGGTGKIPGGIPHLRHHRDGGLNTDGAVEPAEQ